MTEAKGGAGEWVENLGGWGRCPTVRSRVVRPENLAPVSEQAVISRGLGRAYGDAALPIPGDSRLVVDTTRADRVISFDETSGRLRAEAGFTCGSIREFFLPKGWFTPVSPGTRHVTLGGMVASDIHGKNHHVSGCIGSHINALLMRTGDGKIREVTPDSNPELFQATIGGMGLTGHILEVDMQLEHVGSGWVYQESERRPDLESVIEALGAASGQWPMTVAWIDTSSDSGRGIVMRGRWAKPQEASSPPPMPKAGIGIPFEFPSGLANPLTFGLMNSAYYFKHGSGVRRGLISLDSWFWILDNFENWNRVYGKRGFTQYQCVLPSSGPLFREVLTKFRQLGGCSFVTVFKDCGEAGAGMLSFPQKGTSLALDIPIFPGVQRLVDELNRIVLAHGGRIYLAKDALSKPEDFQRMYPRYDEFMKIRKQYDPELRLQSSMSKRLMGD